MAMWLYQLSHEHWPIERYRLDVWQGDNWRFTTGKIHPRGQPLPGDQVVFYYTPSAHKDSGFYGWAVITRYDPEETAHINFRPVSPSDHLKMYPWWPSPLEEGGKNRVQQIVDLIRGGFAGATLYPIDETLADEIRKGITAWIAGSSRC